MLTQRRVGATALVAFLTSSLVAASCSSSQAPASPPPSTVADASVIADAGRLALNVGMILNSAAPTAERDRRLSEVMTASAAALDSDVAVQVLTQTIDDVDDVPAAIGALVDQGVTVIATSCDDSTMPQVVEAAIASQLLAVTACVTIPRPDLAIQSRLFIDLAGLNDAPVAIENWMASRGFANVAVMSSELITDVDETCAAIASALRSDDRVLSTSSFTGLLDDPMVVVVEAAEVLEQADALVVCALAPTLGDVVSELRDSGFDQPVVVPWFGEPQSWPGSTSDVFIVSPASRYSDDPETAVMSLFDDLTNPEAVDVVAADSLAILADAAGRAGSSGSQRLADAMRIVETEAISGVVLVDTRQAASVERSYRVLEIVDGEPEFVELTAVATG